MTTAPMQTALATAQAFVAKLPPQTGPDFAQFVADLGVGLKAELNEAIQAKLGHIPFAPGIAENMVDGVVDTMVTDLSATVQTGGA